MERFWSKVEVRQPDECWPWTAAVNEHGYGVFRLRDGGRLNMKAHRMMWELCSGERLSSDVKLLHACDNPPCCNPAHLFKGTQLDNIADMVVKGRVAHGAMKPNTKLTDADVDSMCRRRALGETQSALATAFGVTQSRVSVITRKVLTNHG
jgi:hypothetical protein